MTELTRSKSSIRDVLAAGVSAVLLAGVATLGAMGLAFADSGNHMAERLYVGLGAQGRSFETMSVADIRPMTHGEFGGRTEIGYRVAGPWWVVATGHFGGAWFDFNGPAVSGKIEDFSWLVRGGTELHVPAFRRVALYLGLGGEYGESRSWLDAASASDEGPEVYSVGAYVKA
ncbi:MAG: hypothetical protein ACRD1T_00655, partial [Acidimicrobiia bacterium]